MTHLTPQNGLQGLFYHLISSEDLTTTSCLTSTSSWSSCFSASRASSLLQLCSNFFSMSSIRPKKWSDNHILIDEISRHTSHLTSIETESPNKKNMANGLSLPLTSQAGLFPPVLLGGGAVPPLVPVPVLLTIHKSFQCNGVYLEQKGQFPHS